MLVNVFQKREKITVIAYKVPSSTNNQYLISFVFKYCIVSVTALYLKL